MQTAKTVAPFARSLALWCLLDPRALTAVAAVAALCAGRLLGPAAAEA